MAFLSLPAFHLHPANRALLPSRNISWAVAVLLLASPVAAEQRLRPKPWFEAYDSPGQAGMYKANLPNSTVLLSETGICIRFADSKTAEPVSVETVFPGSHRSPLLPEEFLPISVNHPAGNGDEWRNNIPVFASVRERAIYPGIDIVYRGVAGAIEYDFRVRPGADPNRIRLQISGATRVFIDSQGSLVATVADGTVQQTRPVAFQDINGTRTRVEARYVELRHGQFGVRPGRYDRRRPLTIDPVLTYMGTLNGNSGSGIATDYTGAVYITGVTDFPTTAFVTKLSPDDSTVVYSTTLNSNGVPQASGITVDGAGSAYVITSTYNGYHTGLAEGIQVTKLSPDGQSVAYQTSLPGPGWGQAIAVDAQGNAYITGATASDKFPVTQGAPQGKRLGQDAFVAKLSPSGQIVYATFLGGSGEETGYAIAIDSGGNAYVTGVTHNTVDFPLAGAAQSQPGGAFVYSSADAGTTWQSAGKGLITGVTAMTVDPFNEQTVYAALATGGLAKTTNGGADWVSAGKGLGSGVVNDIAVNPKNPATVYAASGDGLYKSVDGANSWTLLSTPLVPPALVVADPLNDGVVYAGGSGLAKSTDGGKTWSFLLNTDYNVYSFAVDPSNPLAIYVSTFPNGVQKSIDGGVTWISASKGISYPNSSKIALAPSHSSTLYVNDPAFTYRSDDNGATWRRLGSSPSYVAPIAIDPVDPEVAYSWTGRGSYAGGTYIPGELYKYTTTSGWTTASLPLFSGEAASISGIYTTAFAVAPSNHNVIYYAAGPGSDAFVTKIDSSGTHILYSTYLGGHADDAGYALGLDANGNAYVAGSTSSTDFPVSPGATQSKFLGSRTGSSAPRGSDAFVAKIDSTGSRVSYATYLGGSGIDSALALAVEPDGNAWVSGSTDNAAAGITFPQVNDSFSSIPNGKYAPTTAFLSRLSPDGTQLRYSTIFGATGGGQGTSVALDTRGNLVLTGFRGANMQATPNASTTGGVLFTKLLVGLPAILSGGIVDAFTFQSTKASPGSVVALFGTALTSGQGQATNVPLPANLSGTSVTVGGKAAPLFYSNSGQINLQIPWETAPGTTQVAVTNGNGTSAATALTIVAASPAIATYSTNGHAIAVNQDGTLNSSANPAAAGSVVTFYLVGQGTVTNTPQTGAGAPSSPLARATLPASVTIGNVPSELIYLGLTPGAVGLGQANVRVPDLPRSDYPVVLTINGVSANQVTVSVGSL